MDQQGAQDSQYEFSAPPRTMGSAFQKYRETMNSTGYQFGNPMYDPRIVRGNTYAAIVTQNEQKPNKVTKKMPVRKVQKGSRQPRPRQQMEQQFGQRSDTPPPMIGRSHMPVQTDEYQELLTDKPPEREEECQTNFYIDRPLPRLFVPKKTGVDKDTQIWEGDLFKFDEEVDPILEVLISKTLEQGRMEVIEEEELKRVKSEHQTYEQIRFAELAEVQRLEEKERRHFEEKQRRVRQYDVVMEQEEHGHKKLVSRLLAKRFLKPLKKTCFNILLDQGYFKEPLNVDIQYDFKPWLMSRIADKVRIAQESKVVTENMAFNVKENTIRRQLQSLQAERQRKQDIIDEARRKREEHLKGKQDRAALRRKEREEKRMEEFKQALVNNFFLEFNEVPDLFTLAVTDVDANGLVKNDGAICVLGGFLGEFLLTFSTVQFFAQKEEYAESLGSLLTWDYQKFMGLFIWIFKNLLNQNHVDLPVNKAIYGDLKQIDEDTEIENLKKPERLPGRRRKKAGRKIIAKHIGSTLLNKMLEDKDIYGINQKLVDMVNLAMATLQVQEKNRPRNLKLVVQADPAGELKAYLKAVPERLDPPSTTSRGNSRSGLDSRSGRSRDSGNKTVRKKGTIKRMKKTIKALAAIKGVSGEDPAMREYTLAEYDLDYKCRPVNPNHAETEEKDEVKPAERCLYYHQAAAVNLRREILFAIGEQIDDLTQRQVIGELEIQILDVVNSKADKAETKYLMQGLAKDILIYEKVQY